MIPLSLADINSTYIVKKIGGSPEVKKHLANLGVNVGGEIKTINTVNGNMIIKIKESRLAISDELARKIMV